MKRILTVLVLLAVCGMAYSVTGKVYTRMDTGGVSLNDTGTDMNFDGFTFTYKLSALMANNLVGISKGYFAPINYLEYVYDGLTSLTASSPGYFQISGIKLSDALTVAIDAKWYTLGISTTSGISNLTAKDTVASIGYNELTIQPKVVYVVNDTTTVTMDWSDKPIPLAFYSGASSKTTTAGVTNNGSMTGSQFTIPLKLNTKVGDLAIEAYPYLTIANESYSLIGVGGASPVGTNTGSYSATAFGGYVQGTYPLNDTMKVQGKLALDSASSALHIASLTATNDTNSVSMDLGVFGELIWAVAPQTTVNLGLGFKAPLGDTVKGTDLTKTNVVTTTAYGLQAYDAVIDFGGSTKFAQNWTLGINGQMVYTPNQSANNEIKSGSTLGTNTSTTDEAIKFNNVIANGVGTSAVNWDLGDGAKSIFIQYDIDTVSIRFAIDKAGQGVFNAARLDLSYTY